jgi:hypothetical protein
MLTFGAAKPMSTKKIVSRVPEIVHISKKTLDSNEWQESKIQTTLEISVRNILKPAHEKVKRILLDAFGDVSSTKTKKLEGSLFYFTDRMKGNHSIGLKAASNGWGTRNEILTHMGDVSGFCFVLEDPKALPEFINRFGELIKSRKFEVLDAEYHRLPPKFKKNKVEKSYESMKPDYLQKLKNIINKVQNPTTQIWHDTDSRSGYSGLHITIRDRDGHKHEIQVMIRSIYDVKYVENLLYKLRNGKSVAPQYEPIEPLLQPLKKKSAEELEQMTPKEVAIYNARQQAMTKYTQENYIEALSRPYNKTRQLLTVEAATLSAKEKELIDAYDFNKILPLMEACDKVAEKSKKK